MIAPVLDHLWQSTLFACAAALIVLALRRHAARARYWLWFSASAKFLIPYRQCIGDTPAAKLAGLGSLRSEKFLGFIKHGVSIEGLESSTVAHWEAYEVVQTHGSSVWLVFATVDGAIQQIAVAIR